MIGLYCPEINFVNIKKRLKNLFTKYFFYLDIDSLIDLINQYEIKLIYLEKEITITKIISFYLEWNFIYLK